MQRAQVIAGGETGPNGIYLQGDDAAPSGALERDGGCEEGMKMSASGAFEGGAIPLQRQRMSAT